MKTVEFSDRTKCVWSHVHDWLLVGLILFGIFVIIAGAHFYTGAITTFATLFGIFSIIAGLNGLHGSG